MKRTPLARRTTLKAKSSLKRSWMRRTRRTPRHQSPSLRRAYMEANPENEWKKYLGFTFAVEPDASDPRQSRDARLDMPDELNHLFTNPRRDLIPLVIRLTKIDHDWFHDHIDAGRVLCMVAKFRKGEADVALWSVAAGSKDKPRPIHSWVESLDFTAPEDRWLLRYRDELLVRLLELERIAVSCPKP